METITVAVLSDAEKWEARELCWRVFLRFEAPEYPEEGVRMFRKILDDKEYIDSIRMYGAFRGRELAGILAMRDPSHVTLFFVEERFQRQGIGRLLFDRMKAEHPEREFTVNSSPYGIPVYERLGFHTVGPEQCRDGIRSTPMYYREED